MTYQTVGHDVVDLRRLCSGRDARRDPSCPVEVTLVALRGRRTALVIGAVARHRTASWPPRVTYTLTERGRALLPVLRAMWDWGAAEAG